MPADIVQMGDFNYLEIGSGAVTYDGVNLGFLKDVTFISNLELEKLYTGNPLQLRGQKGKQYVCQLQAEMFEVSDMDKASLLLGGGLVPQAVGGSPQTHTNQVKTFAAPIGRSLEQITFDMPTISGGGSAPSIKSADLGTTYVEGTDYLVDYNARPFAIAYRVPSGAIPSGAQVKTTYTGTPPTGRELHLGSSFAVARKTLVFEHYNNETGQIWKATFWIASPDGKANFKWSDSGFAMSQITFDSIPDLVGHPESPYGRIYVGAPAA